MPGSFPGGPCRAVTDSQSTGPAELLFRTHHIDDHVVAMFLACSPKLQEQIIQIGIEDADDPSFALQSLIEHSKSWVPLVDYSPGCSHSFSRRKKPKPPDFPPPDHMMALPLRLDFSKPSAAPTVATAFAEVNTRGKVSDHDDVPPHTPNRKLGCYMLASLGSTSSAPPAAGDCLSESDVDN